jgi:hypothetical protein
MRNNMVVRGGFGTSYDTPDANSYRIQGRQSPVSYIPVQYYGHLSTRSSNTGLIGPSVLSG